MNGTSEKRFWIGKFGLSRFSFDNFVNDRAPSNLLNLLSGKEADMFAPYVLYLKSWSPNGLAAIKNLAEWKTWKP